MKISIGVLAHNESASISKMLNSLWQQSLFQEHNSSETIEIIIVPNGCSDDTAEIAKLTLEQLVKQCVHTDINWKVCEVEQSGKSHAWNLYIHEFSDSTADYLFLMDADIQLLEPHSLRNMIDGLEATPEMLVATDKPIKDIALKKRKNLLDWLSLKGTPTYQNAICGQLYCGRGYVLRKIWLPVGLPVEDGFVRAMVLTDCFTSPEIFKKVDFIPQASHLFQAYTNIPSWIKHEKRIVIGLRINAIIFSYLWANCSQNQDAGELIKYNNECESAWLFKLIDRDIQERGLSWWLPPHIFLSRRFYKMHNRPIIKASLLFLLFILFYPIDLVIFFLASLEIYRKKGLNYW